MRSDTALDRRFGGMMQQVILRGRLYLARQSIRHRSTGELRVGWFYFHYVRDIGVCLVSPPLYDFRLPFGRQEDLLFRWEPYDTGVHP